jgi:hypothetical protein
MINAIEARIMYKNSGLGEAFQNIGTNIQQQVQDTTQRAQDYGNWAQANPVQFAIKNPGAAAQYLWNAARNNVHRNLEPYRQELTQHGLPGQHQAK